MSWRVYYSGILLYLFFVDDFVFSFSFTKILQQKKIKSGSSPPILSTMLRLEKESLVRDPGLAIALFEGLGHWKVEGGQIGVSGSSLGKTKGGQAVTTFFTFQKGLARGCGD